MHFLIKTGKYFMPVLAIMVVSSGFRAATYTIEHVQAGGPPIANSLVITWLMGTLIGPRLLPVLPGPSLAIKGGMAGLLGLLLFPASCFFLHLTPLDVIMAILVIPAGSALLIFGVFPMASDWSTEPITYSRSDRLFLLIEGGLLGLAATIWITTRFI
jgi:hypothetical protein